MFSKVKASAFVGSETDRFFYSFFLARPFLFYRKQVQIAENEKWFPSKYIIYNPSANRKKKTTTKIVPRPVNPSFTT